MAIYDPFSREQVTILAKYPETEVRFRFGKKEKASPGCKFRWVLVESEKGELREMDLDVLRADDGIREIHGIYESVREIG